MEESRSKRRVPPRFPTRKDRPCLKVKCQGLLCPTDCLASTLLKAICQISQGAHEPDPRPSQSFVSAEKAFHDKYVQHAGFPEPFWWPNQGLGVTPGGPG